MTADGQKALEVFDHAVWEQVEHTLKSADRGEIGRAAELIQESVRNHGRLHVTGIGKPGHLAGYIASLMASTGTPTYFLHGTEAVHGSSGQLVAGDVVIATSNSGNTEELMATVLCAKQNGCKIIGITGNPDSQLAKASDVTLIADVTDAGEGGPLNRAPRNSILAETLVLHDTILEGYLSIMSGDMNTLYKMKDLWTFLGQSFDGADKYLKAIRKARTVADYRLAANAVFRTCPYRPCQEA